MVRSGRSSVWCLICCGYESLDDVGGVALDLCDDDDAVGDPGSDLGDTPAAGADGADYQDIDHLDRD